MNLNDIPEPSEDDLQSVRDILQVYCESLEYTDYIRVIAHLVRQGRVLASYFGEKDWEWREEEVQNAIKTFEEIE